MKADLLSSENVYLMNFFNRLGYSMGDLINQKPLGNHTSVHLYHKLKICNKCRVVYEKIDGYRTKVNKQTFLKISSFYHSQTANSMLKRLKKLLNFSKKNMIFPVLKYSFILSLEIRQAKPVFSGEFYKKLKEFGKGVLEQMGLTKEIENIDGFFETKRTNTNANNSKIDTMYFSKDDDGFGFETNRSKSTLNLVRNFCFTKGSSYQEYRRKSIEINPKFLSIEKQRQSMSDKRPKF